MTLLTTPYPLPLRTTMIEDRSIKEPILSADIICEWIDKQVSRPTPSHTHRVISVAPRLLAQEAPFHVAGFD